MTRHSGLATGRWFEMSLMEQLGNLGSEVGRVIMWTKKNDVEKREKAIERAFELLDLIIADQRWKTRLKEIMRLREVLVDLFFCDNEYQTSFEFLEKYFLQFGYAARRRD